MENPKFEIATIGLTEVAGEPRVRDLDLADRLGFERARAVRQIIERNLNEIESLGQAPRRMALVDRPNRGAVEVHEYWLNEEQALLVSVLSRAPNAPAVRTMLIKTFVAWRRGQLAPSAVDYGKIGRQIAAIVEDKTAALASKLLPEMIEAKIAESQFSIGQGYSAGEVVGLAGVEGAKRVKGLAGFVSRRLDAFHKAHGVLIRMGRLGQRTAYLFDPATCKKWLAEGGKAAINRYISERSGQGVLKLVPPA